MFRPVNRSEPRSRNRALAILLAVPFLLTLALAIAGIYPYGGTRHDAILVLFAIPAIAIGLDRLPVGQSAKFLKPLLLGASLLICNFFPSPSGPFIRPENQRRHLMQQAVSYLRSLPPGSLLFTDTQGSMVLNYYLCDEAMSLPFTTQKSLLRSRCGNYFVLTSLATQAGFDRTIFSEHLTHAWQEAPNANVLYLFQSGWINDKEQDWLNELRALGGTPRNFGPNILVCPIRRLASASQQSKP